MPEFEVSLFDGSRVASRRVTALDVSGVAAALGVAPAALLAVRPVEDVDAAKRRAPLVLGAARFPLRLFSRELAVLLGAGIPLLEALGTLREKEAGASVSDALGVVIERVREGQSFSTALASRPAAFDPLFVAVVSSAERTGQLREALQAHAAYLAWVEELRARLIAAAVYPAMLVAAGFSVMLFLLVYVVPRFAMVLESASQDLPLMSRGLIGLGLAMHAIQGPLLAVVSAVIALSGWLLWRRVRTGEFERLAIDLAVRLPWLRTHARSFGLAQLARSAAMLIRSGVPALKALRMCRGLLADLDQPRLDMALAAASAGAPLGQSLRDATVIDPLDQRILRVAEQTGQLDSALDRLADLHDASLEQALERVGRVIEPLLMLTIGTVVGGIVVLMYLPIFQLAASIR